MKKKILAMILVFGIFVTGCAKNNEKSNINSNNSNQTSQSENKDKETIYASFYPIYNLTKQIAGDKFNVKSFTNLNTEVHDFEPSAKDMADLSKAKVLFLNGAGLESWQEKIAESSKVEMVDTSKGINLIENTHEDEDEHDKKREDRPKSCCDAPHYHESLDEDEKEDKDNHEDNEDREKEEHEHKDGEEDHHHGAHDPHTWLSPKNGIIQAKNIADKLGEIDPENKDYYEKNFEKIKKELEEIDKEYEKKLENKENKKFLVDHEAFSYLARDYGLIQVPLTSITSTMKNAIDYVKKEKITAIFYEKGGSDKNVKTLADELSLDAKAINTIEYASDDDLKNEKTYQELIRENFEIMESSLK